MTPLQALNIWNTLLDPPHDYEMADRCRREDGLYVMSCRGRVIGAVTLAGEALSPGGLTFYRRLAGRLRQERSAHA